MLQARSLESLGHSTSFPTIYIQTLLCIIASWTAPYKNCYQNILCIYLSYIEQDLFNSWKRPLLALTLCKISSFRWAIFSVFSSTVCCRESFSLSMALMVALSWLMSSLAISRARFSSPHFSSRASPRSSWLWSSLSLWDSRFCESSKDFSVSSAINLC